MTEPEWGEVWWCEHPEIGRRPVVVISRAASIRGRRRTLVAPCSTNVRGIPTEVTLLTGEDPVPQDCAASLDSVDDVSIALLVERLGRLADNRMRQLCAALAVAVDCQL